MVSFSCESCGDVLTKKKLDQHRNRCHGATYTCIDCMVYFPGTTYRSHTSCISEEQKYQGALYKNKKAKTAAAPVDSVDPIEPPKPNKMSHKTYVEDVPDNVSDDYGDYEDNSDDDHRSPAEPLPEAPTPPPAPEAVNVFDFLVASNTPNASQVNFAHEETQLVRYDYDANGYDANGCVLEGDELVQYGAGPIPTAYQTPAAKVARKKSKEGTDVKTDKKRKRLHIETDQVMTDAPPVLHSGLTGGLNRLMRPVFPPSPDYSGGDAAPTSPIKKSKHSKSSKGSRQDSTSISNNLLALMTTGSKTKTKKKKSSSKKTSARAEKATKLIEYRPNSRDSKGEAGNGGQMVVFKPRADVFLSFITKGPESERGCSMNKVLKRYHRERSNSGESLGKLAEEKELWRSLRMRKNERGEIVLFTV
ncbi:hypothetical protein jhhlp_007351 [Lomentospora prolificans]|uniref:Zinc finger C2H2 LYAR-type domain-containing protein n=1 Tax=Lomentospora prolificans TaxID=41688 RepID=A0A2N3N2G0_9PEZI|nr:hypothetical protein jhhlp_007351 [Lomentospora prolificans]